MGLFEHLNKRIKHLDVRDFGIFKITLIAFTLMIAKVWPVLLSWEWHWYGLIFIVGYFYILWKFFGKGS